MIKFNLMNQSNLLFIELIERSELNSYLESNESRV